MDKTVYGRTVILIGFETIVPASETVAPARYPVAEGKKDAPPEPGVLLKLFRRIRIEDRHGVTSSRGFQKELTDGTSKTGKNLHGTLSGGNPHAPSPLVFSIKR
jgi:hypothetical protein